MPKLTTATAIINYVFENNDKTETIVFSNSLGTNYGMWQKVVEMLNPHFNILRYDTRGHGGSQLGTYSDSFFIEDLGKDVVELIAHLGLEKLHFCGLSMGGLIGQWLGINAGNCFKTIILANTAAKIGTTETWNARVTLVQNEGFDNLSQATKARWFTEAFLESDTDAVATIIDNFKLNNKNGYSANCRAIKEADFTKEIQKITVPTLIIAGKFDFVTTVADGEFLVKNISTATLEILDAAHLSAVELPKAFAELIIKHTKNN